MLQLKRCNIVAFLIIILRARRIQPPVTSYQVYFVTLRTCLSVFYRETIFISISFSFNVKETKFLKKIKVAETANCLIISFIPGIYFVTNFDIFSVNVKFCHFWPLTQSNITHIHKISSGYFRFTKLWTYFNNMRLSLRRNNLKGQIQHNCMAC